MTPCYILKRSLTKVNLLNTPDTWGGGLSQETGPPQNFTPPYNDVVLYSKTNFNKSQPPRFPQHLGVGLSHKPDYHKTLTSTFPLTIMCCYISKRSFTNVNLLNFPNSGGGVVISQTGLPQNSISPPYNDVCYILKQTSTNVKLLNSPNMGRGLSQKPDYVCIIFKKRYLIKINVLNSTNTWGVSHKPVLRRYFGTFQKPRTFDVKSTGFLKKPKIWTSLFWVFSKTRYFCCRNLGIFTRVKILGYFTRNYRADCDFIRRAKYSWSSIFGRCFMRMSQVC